MNATVKPPKEIVRKPEDAKNGKKPLPSPDRQALIDGLNHDLAGEYQAIMMYIHYSAMLTGPFRRDLRALFQAEVADEQGHAQFLSDKIAAMGGEPTTEPKPVRHVNQPRQMLDCALSAEVQAIADYTTRIRQAESCGELGLKVALDNQLADETRHKEELERIIAGWYEINPERDLKENRLQDIGGQG
jgi:bacterioferritin